MQTGSKQSSRVKWNLNVRSKQDWFTPTSAKFLEPLKFEKSPAPIPWRNGHNFWANACPKLAFGNPKNFTTSSNIYREMKWRNYEKNESKLWNLLRLDRQIFCMNDVKPEDWTNPNIVSFDFRAKATKPFPAKLFDPTLDVCTVHSTEFKHCWGDHIPRANSTPQDTLKKIRADRVEDFEYRIILSWKCLSFNSSVDNLGSSRWNSPTMADISRSKIGVKI